MSSYEKAVNVFNTTFESDKYFESLSSEYTKNSLLKTITDGKTPLIFLLGEPGVGKTYMLNLLMDKFSVDKKILFTSEPFSTPESFLSFLLKDSEIDKNINISELKEEAIKLYKDVDNLIIIDEAQLLKDSVLEFIRTLSDTNHFNFLLSMHKQEGEKIVKKAHFLSRDHQIVTLGVLQNNEIKKYIESQLLLNGLGTINDLFDKNAVKHIGKLSVGNFRIMKQLVKHCFLIMDYAKIHGHIKYTKPNSCVITMSAIDLGIIDA